jgi:hypothetical protein
MRVDEVVPTWLVRRLDPQQSSGEGAQLGRTSTPGASSTTGSCSLRVALVKISTSVP